MNLNIHLRQSSSRRFFIRKNKSRPDWCGFSFEQGGTPDAQLELRGGCSDAARAEGRAKMNGDKKGGK